MNPRYKKSKGDPMKQRKKLRLEGYDYSTTGGYFITLHCKKDTAPFWDWKQKTDDNTPALSFAGKAAVDEIGKISDEYPKIHIDETAILPDHIHFILILEETADTNISDIVNKYKGRVSRRIGFSPWQRSYYDRIIRDEDELNEIRKYIRENVFKEYLKKEQGGTHYNS